MQLKRKEMLTSVVDDMRTQKMYTEINKDFFFLGGGVICKLPKFSNLAANRRPKFRNTHWPGKSLTIMEEKPWKLFCKTSLNARKYLFSKSVDKKYVWPCWKKCTKRNFRY